MIEIKSPFSRFHPELIRRYLTENEFELKFSLKQKLYYNLFRPILPLHIRWMLQKYYNAKVDYRQDFIDPSLTDFIHFHEDGDSVLRTLYPTSFTSALVLTHDIETAEGFRFVPRLIELEAQYNFKSSWYIVPYKYKIDKGIIQLIKDSGDEIGIQGYNHDGKLYSSEKVFTERSEYINRALKEYHAVGFRSPMVHRNLRWLQKLNIEYDSSCFDYDPFQPFPGGTGSIWPFQTGKFIELPYTMPQDHVLFHVLQEQSSAIWKNKANWIAKNHGVILMLTHPDYLRENDNLKYYEETLQYLSTFKNSWHCLPYELAAHFRSILIT